MDEPGWSWPAWKFGMKREDLTTKLHEQYNTFASAIQDPEAFHHDVSEISHEASTPDEFHRLMAARKQQRLQELHDSLESAAFEIIAHPKLIGTEQWQYAIQLFRTRSLDSLVRYFSSYLSKHEGYDTPSVASSFSEHSVNTTSTNPSSIDDHIDDGNVPVPTYLAGEHDVSFTHEPDDIHDGVPSSLNTKIPHFRRSHMKSSTTPSEASDDIVSRDYALHPPTHSRAPSFSASESESIPHLSKSLSDDETSQSSEGDSPAASEPDMSESRSSLDSMSFPGSEPGCKEMEEYCVGEDEGIPTAQPPMDSFFDDDFETVQIPYDTCGFRESETPTPRQEAVVSSYLDSKSRHPIRVRPSPRASSPKSPRLRHREGSSPQYRGRSPEELFSRIQKPLPDSLRTRPKGRRRLD